MLSNPVYQSYNLDPVIGVEIALLYNRTLTAAEGLDGVPAYLFDIVLHNGTRIGQIDLRLESTPFLVQYGGQVGYGIDRAYRGNGYAALACHLLANVARLQGFEQLWITCNPENIASVRTCEKIGAQFIDQVQVPVGSELWRRGDREKLRFLWTL